MAVETFNYLRQAGAAGTFTYKVLETEFGDGYTQAVADGLNNETQKWPLAFEGGIDDIQPIIDFFRRHKGHKSFYWTPPGSSGPLLWRVKNFTLQSKGGGIYNLSAEFNQVYSL